MRIFDPKTGRLTRRYRAVRFMRAHDWFGANNPATWMFALAAACYVIDPGARPFAHMLMLGALASPFVYLHWAGVPGMEVPYDWITGFCC
jgi:hypothetical protein